MRPADRYRHVAMLHAANIERGFLATLGLPFLALMYQAIDEVPEAVLITEEQDDRVLGFVSGGLGMRPIYRQLLRHPLRLATSLAPSLLRPARLKRILDIVAYGRKTDGEASLPHAELLSIAVDPAARGTGVSERLYARLVREFALRGVGAFRITVGDSLARAHAYYRRMGALAVGREEVHAGEGSVVYVHRIPARGNDA